MARIRSIKPEFWTSEQVTECSLNARLLFIGLWNFADDLGRMPMSAKSIKAKVFPADDMPLQNVSGMLQELSRNGLILPYEVDGKEYLQITGWQHQRIDKPQPGKYPAPVAGYSTNDPGVVATDRIGKEEEGKERKGERRAPEFSTIGEDFELTDADIAVAHDAGMTDATVDTERKLFIARKQSDGKQSANWSAEWRVWCERWKAMKPKQAPEAGDPITPDKIDQEKVVRMFAKTGIWSKWAGPEPGQLGCVVPAELFAKHGLLPDGRKIQETQH
jgi:hypothetical protein